ncbi:MAG: CPXCG motif-containing cysteine-rich protein [Halioglobus sp.]|nr:CPXCG motif-containing cysteine-rich protein [Halioglobus sp.]
MAELELQRISCPYCGESIEVLVDAQEAGQQYIEDCQVCCRPITFSVAMGFDGELALSVYAEDESF